MSALQKQLLARRGNSSSNNKTPGSGGRVNLKQKKFLAMMEEETSLNDSSKNARLVGYKKAEVCWGGCGVVCCYGYQEIGQLEDGKL